MGAVGCNTDKLDVSTAALVFVKQTNQALVKPCSNIVGQTPSRLRHSVSVPE